MIHQLSDVKSTKIGDGTRIWQYAVVLEGAAIGQNCNINCHTFIENDVLIGDRVTVKSGVYLWDGIVIEDDVFIGPNVTFVNDRYPRSGQRPEVFGKTLICRGASIGAAATLLCGITVGANAMVGAGSLVTADVPPHTLWYGSPAVHQGFVTKEGIVLDLQLKNKRTGEQYAMEAGELVRIH